MSKKAHLLTTNDVPEYIKEIVKRLHPVLMDYEDNDGNNWWGYTFKLKAKYQCGYENQLHSDCEKLIKWCKGWYAHAEIIRYEIKGFTQSEKRKAWKEGWRNHALLVISDPVSDRFEKDGFYRNEKKYATATA